MKPFNLLKDKWVPAQKRKLLSLEEAWANRYSVSLVAPIFLKASLIRLFAAIQIHGGPEGLIPSWSLSEAFQKQYDRGDARGSKAIALLNHWDENGVAWEPHIRASTEVDVAQALVAIYFSDRPGIKARIPGSETSGSAPPHISKTSIFKDADNLGEFLDLNVDPSWGKDHIDFLLHPWRRILVVSPENIIVVAGSRYAGPIEDPWAFDGAKIRHIDRPLEEKEAKRLKELHPDCDRFYSISLVLKMASVLAAGERSFWCF